MKDHTKVGQHKEITATTAAPPTKICEWTIIDVPN